jgi:hypothetical protein
MFKSIPQDQHFQHFQGHRLRHRLRRRRAHLPVAGINFTSGLRKNLLPFVTDDEAKNQGTLSEGEGDTVDLLAKLTFLMCSI